MVAPKPNQKRLEYELEISTRLVCRVEIHSRITRNLDPSQYPTNAEITMLENAYANLHPDLTIADRANTTTRTERIPSKAREFKRRARAIPGTRP